MEEVLVLFFDVLVHLVLEQNLIHFYEVEVEVLVLFWMVVVEEVFRQQLVRVYYLQEVVVGLVLRFCLGAVVQVYSAAQILADQAYIAG